MLEEGLTTACIFLFTGRYACDRPWLGGLISGGLKSGSLRHFIHTFRVTSGRVRASKKDISKKKATIEFYSVLYGSLYWKVKMFCSHSARCGRSVLTNNDMLQFCFVLFKLHTQGKQSLFIWPVTLAHEILRGEGRGRYNWTEFLSTASRSV